MGLMDKITGRAKKATGDVTDSASLRQQGRKEEEKGEAKEEAARAEEHADQKSREAQDLDRKT
ncbi:MAG: CsbD family protein [Thermoleophilaceae bacterium]|nr:CsbD family protein [Thermoleophilaceae bacterium]